MLSDIERKMLRVISNYSMRWREMPSIRELEIKTGRSRRGVLEVLKTLNNEGYIEWSESSPENIVLIEAWERGPGYQFKSSTFNSKNSPFLN
ncbi:hypothetical protein [Paenibacillus rigui]|uniref:hypothetical protein n=1 Tax=Paenibacillus rigui TaxID=554312 RepID=UPI0015C621E6|nr:hypothetical protein [Paenibacillus rigui]